MPMSSIAQALFGFCAGTARRQRGVLVLVLFGAVCVAHAQEIIRPPCDAPPVPDHAVVGAAPAVVVLKGDAANAWRPPTCSGWGAGQRDVVIAVAARFQADGAAAALLERIGAISMLTGLRYWSVTDKAWRVLITDAAALAGREGEQRRRDFSPAELQPGAELFSLQTESRLGQAVYRLRVREASATRLVFETDNVTALRALLMTVVAPGAFRSLYFLEHESDDIWRYYALVSVQSARARNHEASFVNRAVALYRYLAGVPVEQMPPAAP
jgi:hypothetical protein